MISRVVAVLVLIGSSTFAAGVGENPAIGNTKGSCAFYIEAANSVRGFDRQAHHNPNALLFNLRVHIPGEKVVEVGAREAAMPGNGTPDWRERTAVVVDHELWQLQIPFPRRPNHSYLVAAFYARTRSGKVYWLNRNGQAYSNFILNWDLFKKVEQLGRDVSDYWVTEIPDELR